MKKFPVSNSTYVSIITYGLGLFILFLPLLWAQRAFFHGVNFGILKIVSSLVLLGVGAYFFANSPKNLIVDKNTVTIEKNFGKVKIAKADIQKVGTLANNNLAMTVGSKGFFGFLGKTMGNSQSFVKDRSQMIKLETSNGDFVLSCKDRAGFIKAVNEM